MDEKKTPVQKPISRRNLLKGVGALGAIATAASISKIPGLSGSDGMAYAVTEAETIPAEISSDYKRMDQKYTTFMRAGWDPEIAPLLKTFLAKRHGQIPYEEGPRFIRCCLVY